MAENITVSEGDKKPKLPKWLLIGAAVAIVVLAAGAGALVRYLQRKPATTVNTTLKSQPKSVVNAQSLLADGKTSDADKAVQDALNDPSVSNDDKAQLYVQQGRIDVVKEDYQGAADAYTKAWNLKQSYEVASKLGAIWQNLGDKTKALSYYKKALELIPKDSPTYDSDSRELQQMIDALESGQ